MSENGRTVMFHVLWDDGTEGWAAENQLLSEAEAKKQGY
jgi:hypothetical protein